VATSEEEAAKEPAVRVSPKQNLKLPMPMSPLRKPEELEIPAWQIPSAPIGKTPSPAVPREKENSPTPAVEEGVLQTPVVEQVVPQGEKPGEVLLDAAVESQLPEVFQPPQQPLEWTASEADTSLIVYQRICRAIQDVSASKIDVLAGLKTESERLALVALARDDREAQQQFWEARFRAIQRMGEIFTELNRPLPPREETGRFTSGVTVTAIGGEYGDSTVGNIDVACGEEREAGEKFKADVAKQAGISLRTARRYQQLAGPSEPESRKAVREASEQYFAEKRQKAQLPTAKELLKVVEKAAGVEPEPEPEPTALQKRADAFLRWMRRMAAKPDQYDALFFAQCALESDQEALAVLNKFCRDLQARLRERFK
jgi:hypothetical protein